MKTMIAALLLVPFMAQAHGHEHHREHKAHKHGTAELSIAFQGHEGRVEFRSPAESIIGFEHAATKEADIKTRDAALAKFESEIKNIVQFQADYKCAFTKDRVEQVIEAADGKDKAAKKGTHSDFLATFNVKCERAIDASTVTVEIQKAFPKVKEMKVTVLVDAIQKEVVVKKKAEKIEIN